MWYCCAVFGDLPMKNDSCPAVKLPKATACLLMTAPSEGTKATDPADPAGPRNQAKPVGCSHEFDGLFLNLPSYC